MKTALLMLAALAFACNGPRPDATPLDPQPNSEPANNTATNTVPDRRDGWTPGAHDRSVMHDDLQRTFRLYIPAGYDTEPMPLLLVFHGGVGNGDSMVAVGFDEVADRDGFVVVYPDGIHSNWSDGRGTTDAEVAGIDDIGFVRTLIDELRQQVHIDPDRVFATGASNGGMFSYRISCELSDLVAAIGPVIAAMPSELRCEPQQPVSVISFHGTDDPFIPIDGGDTAHKEYPRLGDGGLVDSAQATMQQWHALNGCDAATTSSLPPTDDSDPTRVRLTTAQCEGATSVHTYVVDGMGHTWPGRGGLLEAVSGARTNQINATETIWAFFATRGR